MSLTTAIIKKPITPICIFYCCLIIGASLSEPHTSELNGGIFIYIYIYIIKSQKSFLNENKRM